jgi:hypothetical protein
MMGLNYLYLTNEKWFLRKLIKTEGFGTIAPEGTVAAKQGTAPHLPPSQYFNCEERKKVG